MIAMSFHQIAISISWRSTPKKTGAPDPQERRFTATDYQPAC